MLFSFGSRRSSKVAHCTCWGTTVQTAHHEHLPPLHPAQFGRKMSAQLDPRVSPVSPHLQKLSGSFQCFPRCHRHNSDHLCHHPSHPYWWMCPPGHPADQIPHLFAGSNPWTSLQSSAVACCSRSWFGPFLLCHSEVAAHHCKCQMVCLHLCDCLPVAPRCALRFPAVWLHSSLGGCVLQQDSPVLGLAHLTDPAGCRAAPNDSGLCSIAWVQNWAVEKSSSERPNYRPQEN